MLARYMLSSCVRPSVRPTVASASPRITNHPWKGRGQVTYVLVGTNHISGTAEARVVKFWSQVGCVKFRHMGDKSPLKRAWPICNLGPNDISGTAEARVVKFYAQVDYIMS